MNPVIHHGTPLTPRDALHSLGTGRAMCVSFFRPDDVEVVEAISPAIMFRQRRVFVLAASPARRTGLGRGQRLVGLFRLVGAAPVPSGPLGGDPRQPGRAFPAQRRTADAMAVRAEGLSAMAYGSADQPVAEALRSIRSRRAGVDWNWQGRGGWRRGMVPQNGRGGGRDRQRLARPPHDARHVGCAGISLYQRGQHIAGAERMAL